MEKLPGKMVVLEGIDGCGKTTLASKVAHGRDTYVNLPSPSWEGTGARVRRILMGQEPSPGPWALQMLFAIDRYEVVERTLLPHLRAGKTVVCDRWWYSGLVYGLYDGLTPVEVTTLYARLPVLPDLVVHLKVDPVRAAQREGKGAGTDMYDGNLARQTALAHSYDVYLGDTHYAAHQRSSPDQGLRPRYREPRVVDANRPVDEVLGDVLALIAALP